MSDEVTCAKCGAHPLSIFYACDRDNGEWCQDCFPKTDCGKGKHGEGCPTKVFTDD